MSRRRLTVLEIRTGLEKLANSKAINAQSPNVCKQAALLLREI